MMQPMLLLWNTNDDPSVFLQTNIIGTGVLMTVLTRFFQFRRFGHMWKNTIGGLFNKEKGIRKDKSGEKTIESDTNLPLELRTDGTDAWDTNIIGCLTQPYDDGFIYGW